MHEPHSPIVKERPGNIVPLPSRPSPLLDAISPRSTSSIGTDRSYVRPYVSKIGILPSSVPKYHKEFMEAHRSGKAHDSLLSNAHAEVHEPVPQTDAEKAETARRLNPHSKSHQRIEDAAKKPAGMTQLPAKKVKPTKWQFGIRSRNQPLEAIGCIYRALQKLGAEWKTDEDEQPVQNSQDAANKDNNPDDANASGASLHHSSSMLKENKMKFNGVDKNGNYKLPDDPWVLHVRWKKDGMYLHPLTPHYTLTSPPDIRRHSIASLHSNAGSAPPPEPKSPTSKESIESVIMHLDIQLYEMEPGVYLVDFKCAGYETADGMMCEEKDVTSPFPFLDLASKLIIQLAEAD
jgi:carbon catabolite-derepressing protein kinase